MLIALQRVENEQALKDALASPIKREDCAFYVTEMPEAARALAQRKLPCIFLEGSAQETKKGAGVYGVDLILQGDNMRGKPGGTRRECSRSCQTDAAGDESVRTYLDDAALTRLWQRHYGLPWTIARTERLIIRESVMEDLTAFLAMYGGEAKNPDVTQFAESPEETLYLYIKRQYPLYGYGLWTIAEKSTGEVIGRIGIENDEAGERQLSYLIARKYRRRGYAKEAAQAVLAYAREALAFRDLKLCTSDGNTASQKLAFSLGFRKTVISGNSYTIDLTSR